MKEYFLFGILCLINPVSGDSHCAYINEQPIIYYEKNQCEDRKVEKTAEIANSFTKHGFKVSHINLSCIVDNINKPT